MKQFFHISLLFIAFTYSYQSLAEVNIPTLAKGIIFLVPGTLNSLVPGDPSQTDTTTTNLDQPYYSEIILSTIKTLGYSVNVITDLLPTGDLQLNSNITTEFIEREYEKNYPDHQMPIILIGHSAGGLYALKAADQLRHLPIKKVALISTPLQGSFVADRVFSNSSANRQFVSRLNELSNGYLDLRGLPELTSDKATQFLSTIHLSPSLTVYAFTGSQSRPAVSWENLNCKYLSPLFSFTTLFTNKQSDGIIEAESSFGKNVTLLNTNNTAVTIYTDKKIQAKLDHAEQVVDYRYLQLMGFNHTKDIEYEQKSFYQKILNFIENCNH